MGKLITSVSTIKQEGSTKAASMALTDFVDHLSAPGTSFAALTSSSFPSLTAFNSNTTTEAQKWTDLEQCQIVSTHTVNTQHGQSVILSLQKADGSSCSAWACGMLASESVAAEPYEDGDGVANWSENEKAWKRVQFIPAAAMLIVCKLFM